MTDSNRRRLTVGTTPDASSLKGGKDTKARLITRLGADDWGEDSATKPDFGKQVQCIHSVTDGEMKKKRSFAEKDKMVSIAGAVIAVPEHAKSLEAAKVTVHYTCRKGLKPESPNQDSYVVVILPGKWALYGVFDGHGPNGHDVSDMAIGELCDRFLKKDFIGKTGQSFTEAFEETQNLITAETDQAKKKEAGMVDASSSGSTCTMAFHNMVTDILTIAHVGDSRGVLYQGAQAFRSEKTVELETKEKAIEKEKCETAVDILYACEDHKPNLPGEKKRIESKGGRVVFDGYYNYRVFAQKGMYPGLNMSRALGDCVAHKEAGLSAEPELKEINLKELRGAGKQLTLVIASDGVWEFIGNYAGAGYLIKGSGDAGCKMEQWGEIDVCQKTVDALAKKSWDSWMADSDNEISDDITVLSTIL